MKTPEQIGRQVIDNHYGIGTEWEEPNQFGEEGFTRAQAESDIDADDVRLLIEEGIEADRAQIASALQGTTAVPDISHGMHSTYLTDDGSCDLCGDKNRG